MQPGAEQTLVSTESNNREMEDKKTDSVMNDGHTAQRVISGSSQQCAVDGETISVNVNSDDEDMLEDDTLSQFSDIATSDIDRRFKIAELSKTKNIDVFFLQETLSTAVNEVDWGMTWRVNFFLNHGTNLSAGVAILFSQHLTVTNIVPYEVDNVQ